MINCKAQVSRRGKSRCAFYNLRTGSSNVRGAHLMNGIKCLHLLHRTIALGVVFVVVASVFIGRQRVSGEGREVLPWSVGTVPTRGDELPVDQGVLFTFNTAMNHTSVEAAFDVTPAAAGTFQWQGDTALTFIPAKPFDRETAYIFTIDSHATSKVGTPL